MSKQLCLLPIDDFSGNLYKEEDFLPLPENSESSSFLSNFFKQNDFLKAEFPSLILKGDFCSGKSHLLHSFAQKNELIEFLDFSIISKNNLSNYFIENHFYILENVNQIKNEEFLFHLINLCVENKAFLIFSTQNNLHFKLKDLDSRIKNIITTEIKNPSLQSVKHLLENHLARRQIRITRPVLNFVSNNIKRNYKAIIDAAKLVEFYVREQGKKINIKEAKILFSNLI